jgi:hypothetical protein
MRTTIRQQLSLVEPSIEHEHARELGHIRLLVHESPQIAKLIEADLTRGLSNPRRGRRGKMSAEQVLMALLIKQMNGFSYC